MGALSLGRFVSLRSAPLPAGAISGTTKIAGTPDAPAQRLVQLFVCSNAHGTIFPTSAVIAWGWSDPAGNWQFNNIDPALRYGIIAYDHTGTYDPVVKLNLIPTP